MIDFCTRLAAELGHPVQANAYVTPPPSRGFSAHYDVHDVFVLQLAGRKHWTIHAPVLADPAARPAVGPASDRRRRRGAGAAGDRHGPRAGRRAVPAAGLAARGDGARRGVGAPDRRRPRRHPVRAGRGAGGAAWPTTPTLRATLPLGIDVADPARARTAPRRRAGGAAAALDRVPDEAVARRVRRRVWSGGRPEPLRRVAGDGVRRGARARRRRTRSASGCTTACARPGNTWCWSCPTAAHPSRRDGRGRCAPCSMRGTHPCGDLPGHGGGRPDRAGAPAAAGGRRGRRLPTVMRCADAADAAADAREGTAPPAEQWFLLEHPGPWGRVAFAQSGLDAADVSRCRRGLRAVARAGVARAAPGTCAIRRGSAALVPRRLPARA